MKRYIKSMLANNLSGPLFRGIPSRKIKMISAETAENILLTHSPDPDHSALCNHVWPEPQYDLTIIVPVYNVEKYLKRCLNSILNQKTSYNFHVIAVDDGATDGSVQILEEYSENGKISVIHQRNGGLSKARNTGLLGVNGRYIMFVDSDDFLPENAVDALMDAADQYCADIVQGGYHDIDDATDAILRSVCYQAKCNAAPNGTLAGMAWGKVYRAGLFQHVQYPEGYWYEDTIVTGIITHLAKQIVTIPEMVYCYRQNPAGITRISQGNPKSLDTYWVHRSVMRDRKALGLVTDRAFYEHLLRMVALSFKRTEKLPYEVKTSLLVLWKEFLEQERKTDFSMESRYRKLENAIMEGDYGKYSVLCRFCF